MHIEKNVCDSLLGTLLNIPGKTKDGINVRRDLEDMEIREGLYPVPKGNGFKLPPACYTMSAKEKKLFCECLHGVKVPSSYSANIKRLVSLKDCKLLGMKSHDCHVLMTHMIPIAVRGLLTDKVRHTITKLCLFFNSIHSKVIDPQSLESLQKEVIITLCELEMFFPPSFFDVMVHLVIHIVEEVRACGPVFLRYMYPFERYMGFLKGYVRNRNRPEGSIVEGYSSEEVNELCIGYLDGVKSIGVPQSRHSGRLEGREVIGMKIICPNYDSLQLAHFVVLQHMTCIAPYVNEHKETLRSTYKGMTSYWYEKQHMEEFASWLETTVTKNSQDNVDITVKKLGRGPNFKVTSYQGYDINGYTFYTKDQDEKSTMQNSGVTVVATSTQFDRNNRDTRTKIAEDSYYGVIQEIWELEYGEGLTIPVFKCRWVNNRTGVKVDKYGFTLVDLNTNGYTSEPFVLAKLVTQVFFVKDPSKQKWDVVLQGKRRILGVDGVVDEEEYDQFDDLPPFSVGIEPLNGVIGGEPLYKRSDHDEGIVVDEPRLTKRKRNTKE